jgi:hypothetical protein
MQGRRTRLLDRLEGRYCSRIVGAARLPKSDLIWLESIRIAESRAEVVRPEVMEELRTLEWAEVAGE